MEERRNGSINRIARTSVTRLVLFLLVTAISACGQEAPPRAVEAQVVPAATRPQKPTFTKDQWKATFRGSFAESESKADEDGINRYTACFRKAGDGKCVLLARGKHDGFRKLDHLTLVSTLANQIVGDVSFVGIYITALECDAPSIMVAPDVNSRNGWLFMSKVALMANGNVVLERSFEFREVDRDNDAGRIRERATFIANDAEREGLKAFVSAQSKIIRITGQKGYITIDKKRTDEFVSEARDILEIIGQLESAFSSAGGPRCSGG